MLAACPRSCVAQASATRTRARMCAYMCAHMCARANDYSCFLPARFSFIDRRARENPFCACVHLLISAISCLPARSVLTRAIHQRNFYYSVTPSPFPPHARGDREREREKVHIIQPLTLAFYRFNLLFCPHYLSSSHFVARAAAMARAAATRNFVTRARHAHAA